MEENLKLLIQSDSDLVTTREQTRSGFVSMAIEKNYLAIPYVEEAKIIKNLASKVFKPEELLNIKELRSALITSSGLSEKSLKYLSDEDKDNAIINLIEKFLIPANENFVDELVYRYLLTKGDALGGKARNLAGALGERKLLINFISYLNLQNKKFKWRDRLSNRWFTSDNDQIDIEKKMNAIVWDNDLGTRSLILNNTIPLVRKNIDLSIVNIDASKIDNKNIFKLPEIYIGFGELKGGIDPAGADEHWKTANSALIRIRKAFNEYGHVKTFFVGAAIEKSMANEIYNELLDGTLDYAANLCVDNQVTSLSMWISKI